MKLSRFLVAALAIVGTSAIAQVNPLIVTKTVDDGTVGTLRNAITFANGGGCPVSVGPSPTITFNIPSGPFTIQPTSPLPPLTCGFMTIDGFSQPGSLPNTDATNGNNAVLVIAVDGKLCSACSGFDVAGGAVIRGLMITSFAGSGVVARGTGQVNLVGNSISSSGSHGVDVQSGFARIGDGSPGGRNVIASNGGAGVNISGGAIEADVLTNHISGNGQPGVLIGSGSVFADITGNRTISGNGTAGIKYQGTPRWPTPQITSFTYDSIANLTTINFQMSGGAPGPFNEFDFYSNNPFPSTAEGQAFVGSTSITLDAGGNGLGTLTVPGSATYITATYSSCPDGCIGGSSEFSAADKPPVLDISFTPNPLDLASSGVMTMVVKNTNASRTLGQVAFSIGLPSALTNLNESAGTDCNTGVSLAGASSSLAAASNIVLPPGATCTITASIKSSATGTFNFAANSIPVASDAGTGGNPSAASLTVTATPGISVSPSSLNFGTVQTGASSSLTVTVQSTGSAPLDVTGATVSGAGFTVTGNTCTAPINAPATCAITVTFAPTAISTFSGTLAITSSATPSPLNVALSGAGGAPGLQFLPSTLTFTPQSVGTTSPAQTVTLKNTGTVNLAISSITAAGDFGFTGCGVPLTLAPNATCVLSVTFSPQANGPLTGSISVASNGPGSPNALPLSGTGVNGPTPGISVQPFSLGFGPIRVGSQATDRVSIFSNGSAPLLLSGISISGATFAQSNACPASLPVGAGCDITITYSPGTVGTQTGQLTIQSNGTPSTFTVNLTGTAVALLPAALSAPASADFGPHIIGTSTRIGLDLRNTGEQTLNITSMTLSGGGFRLDGTCTSIAPGATCSVGIVFEPGAVQSYTGTLTIASNDARGNATVAITGQGIAVPKPAIELTPDGVGFANQMVTTVSASQAVAVKNVGTAPLHVRGASVTGSFGVAGNTCPAALAPGAQCSVSVTFAPIAAGGATGRLTVDSDAESGRNFASLSGNGCKWFSVPGTRNLQRLCGH